MRSDDGLFVFARPFWQHWGDECLRKPGSLPSAFPPSINDLPTKLSSYGEQYLHIGQMLQISLILSNARWFQFFLKKTIAVWQTQPQQTSSSGPPQLWRKNGRICCITFTTLVLTWSVEKFSSHQHVDLLSSGILWVYIPTGTNNTAIVNIYNLIEVRWKQWDAMGSTRDVKQQSSSKKQFLGVNSHSLGAPRKTAWRGCTSGKMTGCLVVAPCVTEFDGYGPRMLLFSTFYLISDLKVPFSYRKLLLWRYKYVNLFYLYNSIYLLDLFKGFSREMSEEMFTIKPSSFNGFRFREEEFQFQSSDSFMVSNLCEVEREKTPIHISCCSYSQTPIKGH